MAVNSQQYSEAVLFVENNRIARELLFSEFEAVLDGFVPLPDLGGQNATAVYLRINYSLHIIAAVFFRVGFDQEGYCDKRWNIPLDQLATDSARGPDLGGGPIRLACRSQCCIAWHQRNLWDPDMSPGSNHFVLLKKTVTANRLGLKFDAASTAEARAEKVKQHKKDKQKDAEKTRRITQELAQKMRGKFEQEFRDHMARMLKEQRLRILTLNSKRKQEVQQIQLRHQNRVEEYRHQIRKFQETLEQQLNRNKKLKETIDSQATKMEGLREYFEHKLKNAQLDESAQLKAMKKNFEAEVAAKVEAATLEVKEKLQMRDLELMYRSEQEASYKSEIQRLREESQNLIGNSSEQLLEKLEQAGLNFVAYHPGAGHLTIPLADMSRYIENPVAYAASKCGVTADHYKEWLVHYKNPSCQALTSRGEPCGRIIERVPTPGQFHTGEHDRCDNHKTTSASGLAAARM